MSQSLESVAVELELYERIHVPLVAIEETHARRQDISCSSLGSVLALVIVANLT
jgi:hypothetical protein